MATLGRFDLPSSMVKREWNPAYEIAGRNEIVRRVTGGEPDTTSVLWAASRPFKFELKVKHISPLDLSLSRRQPGEGLASRAKETNHL